MMSIEQRSVRLFLTFIFVSLVIVWLIDLKIRVVKLEKLQLQNQNPHQ